MAGRHRTLRSRPLTFASKRLLASNRRAFLSLPGNLRGAITIMFAAFGLTVMVTLVKLAGERLHVTQVLFMRQAVMTAIVAPAILSHFPGCLRTERLDLQLLRVAAAAVAMLCGFTAVIHMPLAEVTALGFAKAFFVTIFAILILGERVGPSRWGAILVGFIGVLVMLRPGTEAFDPVGLLAIAGAAGAGLVMVIIRLLSRTDAPITILSYQAILVGLVVAGPALWFWQWPTAGEWVLLVAIGLVSYGAQMLNIYSYKWGEASVLASLDYVRLLWATLLGWLVFETLPGPWTWVGAAIVIAAALYTVQVERREAQRLVSGPHGRGYTNT